MDGNMTQENVDTILGRLDYIQTKNDAFHARVEQRLDSIDLRLGVVEAGLAAVYSRFAAGVEHVTRH